MQSKSSSQHMIQQFGAAIPIIILFITLLSVPLSAAQQMDISTAQTSAWLFGVYGISSLLSLLVTIYYRQPFVVTGNIFILIFVASLGQQIPYAELIGASIVAGIIVTVITLMGIIKTITALIPEPIVFGLLAGAIMPLVMGIFTSLVEAPIIVGSTFVAYMLGRLFLVNRLPAILPAVIVGLIATALTSQFGQVATDFTLPSLTITPPVFSLNALVTITPIFVILVTLQGNIPSMIFMRTQNFDPPERVINLLSGISTFLGSFLGPTGFALSLPLTAIAASDASGEQPLRYRTIFFTASAGLLIAFLAGIAVTLPELIPLPLLLSLAGLSLVDVLANALQKFTSSPLRLGPLFTFVIALSGISFLGFGAFFWALIVGTGIAFILERDALTQLREQNANH